MAAPSRTSEAQELLLARLTGELSQVPGVVAVALGGSHARGSARPDSDLDVGVYYQKDAPVSVEAVRELAARLDPRPERLVTDLWEWGPWVNGGAWLEIDGQRVDFLYRELDQLDRTLDEAERGEIQWHFGQQPTWGFVSIMLLAELDVCLPLHDPDGELGRRKQRVAVYPEALRARILQDFLWAAEFTLYHARGHARRGDVYNTAGCLGRALAYLIQVLHAEARRWLLNDKWALDGVEPETAREIGEILAEPGRTPEALRASVDRVAGLVTDTTERVGPAYRRPAFALES